KIMPEVSQSIDTADFKKPDADVEAKVEKGSNTPKLPSSYTPSENIVTELFVKGTEPSNVSEKFDQLDPVTNLKADYDEDDAKIHVSWDHKEKDVTFEVSMSTDGGQMKELSTTEDTQLDISDIEGGSTYDIQVVAVDGSLKSDPQTVQ